MGKDINMYGFLGYPILMAADIIIYRAGFVPVGEDQGVHLEFSRELVRRFHHMYNTKIFPEPMPVYSKIPMLPGIDGRKMSKSYRNDISLSASAKEINERVHEMITDPARIRKTDIGHPEVCVVHTFQKIYNEDGEPEISEACRAGQIGCVECKKKLAAIIDDMLAPVRERRLYYAGNENLISETLSDGAKKANERAEETMELVRRAMRI
jgi:tryptophanyl-tRNA synthetase